jgi:PAS domain S-box-containing protein
VTKPLEQVAGAAEAIAAGDYTRRVMVDRRDEIGRLGTAFNVMAQRVAESHDALEARVLARTHEVEQARQELDQFFALSLDLLCIAGMDGRFRRVNPAWEQVLGWTAADLTAVPYLDLVHPDDRPATALEAAKLSDGMTTLSFENRYRGKDGSYRWLSWKAAPLPSRGLIYAAAHDVTEQKRAARDLQQQAAELASANLELEAFSYSVSHDLRAPLRHVAGFATLLEKSAGERLDEQGRRYLKTIHDSAAHMGRLIDDLLTLSRLGRAELRRTMVDLNHIVAEAKREVGREGAAARVDWALGTLPVVPGDASLLRVAFVNLLSNAVKYSSPRAAPRIEVRADGVTPDEAVVYVRDNGVGFDMQYAHKLFGVFQRLHSREEFDGTGIGLATVRRIVQRHGGRVWAEGAVDAGATLFLSIPRGGPVDDRQA